ncbi:MAG TPA: NAD(P)H-dependent glycerol-3-phosphate dehydrogenase [Xanthomonadales bacterium]|nr:NAD(P)H-dependent glycerol-3-phosphate dehydrogenase [Xanthomonadales bacterium]
MKIAVIGAGSWGTALAIQLARSGHHSLLWARNAAAVAEMQQLSGNPRFLPGISFPSGLQVSGDLQAVIHQSEEILLAVPSHAFAELLEKIQPDLRPGQGIAWACKGLQPGTGRLLHQAAHDIVGARRPLAVVTGPSFAIEVARGLPTAVTVAGTDQDYCRIIAQALHGGSFRAYTSDDIVGAELGGAVKNVLAVATGIADGMGLGNNARAALVTRGMAEMMRLGRALKAKQQTLIGLAGLGDLVLTCTGDLSRNRRLGLDLGAGKSLAESVQGIGQVVEGVSTSEEIWRMATRHGVDMPISEQVYGIIHQSWSPAQCLRDLLAREQKPEYI